MSFPNRIDEVQMLPKEEVVRRLAKIRRKGRGAHPVPGPGISHYCVAMQSGIARHTVYMASYGKDGSGHPPISDRTQLLLSVFFARYDAGEFSFIYHARNGNKSGSGWWEMIWHHDPQPVESTVGIVTVTEEGPKISFAKMNRTWV